MSGYERPVELDPADAATALRILESARVPLNGPAAEDLLHSIAALRDGLEASKLPKVPDDLSELLDAGPGPLLAVEPRWELVAPATDLAGSLVGGDPKAIAELDAIGAHVRDVLDELGLSLHDPATVYVVLAGACMIVDLLRIAAEKEADKVPAHRGSRMTYLGLVAALRDYLPSS